MWPSIDHSILSPSGHTSKRARQAALKREHDKLFPDGFPEPKLPERPTEKEVLLQRAHELLELANRGMKPRAYRKKAMEYIEQAEVGDEVSVLWKGRCGEKETTNSICR